MASLDTLLAELPERSLDQLRAAWRERFGAPPPLRSRDLLCRALAERLQEAELGGDPQVERQLRAEIARLRPGRRPKLNRPGYRPGSVLEKEWQGVRQHVEVLADGFRWRSRHYASLSAVARAITGVNWNGPRFFGLRAAAGKAG